MMMMMLERILDTDTYCTHASNKAPMQVQNNCFLPSGVNIAYFIDTDPIDYDMQSSLAKFPID